MDERNFCHWLKGLLESGDIKQLNEDQIKIIKRQLDITLSEKPIFTGPETNFKNRERGYNPPRRC